LESHDRLALDTRVRQQYGVVRLGFDGLRIHGVRLDWHGIVGVRRCDQRLLCRRVERDRGLYGRYDSQ